MTADSEFDLRHILFQGKSTSRPLQSPLRNGPRGTANEDGKSGEEFARWVLDRAGLPAAAYRGRFLERRVPACLRALKASSTENARASLEQEPELLPLALASLLIGVTEFFRDELVFETLRIEISRFDSKALRVWSAGCSNGAELYSVAILLSEAGLLERAFLLGTDCRIDAIRQAETGVYHPAQLGSLSPSTIRRYFEREDADYSISSALRRQAHWKNADFGRSCEEGPWDMILWRNAAIYMNSEAAAGIWRGLVAEMASEAVLVVGKAERPPEDLRLRPVYRCVYQKAAEPRP